MIYVGFVRAMATWRDYFLARSNFTVEPPLFMSLARKDGEVFERSGPVPQHNRDYGLVTRFAGPTGNQILVLTGIGDVGVLAAVRSPAPRGDRSSGSLCGGRDRYRRRLRGARRGDGHSRTELGVRVIGAYRSATATRRRQRTPPAKARRHRAERRRALTMAEGLVCHRR